MLSKPCLISGVLLCAFALLLLVSPVFGAVDGSCSNQNQSCADCVKNISCFYCYLDHQCYEYPFTSLHPVENCGNSLNNISWKTCKIKADILAIIVGVIVGLIALFILILSVYCCCIKPCMRKLDERQSVKWNRKRLQMQNMHEERRRIREQQRNSIRAKYGISGPGGSVYEKF